MSIKGLLSAIGSLPNAIGQGLLGPMPVNSELGFDESSVAQARQQALMSLAAGLVSGQGSSAQRFGPAIQNAQQGFQGRIIDMMREQEMVRMGAQRKAQQSIIDKLAGQDGGGDLAMLAAANPDLFVGEAIKSQFAAKAPGERWRPLTDDEERALGLDVASNWQINEETGKVDKLFSPPAPAASVAVHLPPNESKFLEGMGTNAAKQLDTLQTQADSALKMLEGNAALRPLVNDPNFISGVMGDARLTVAKALGLSGADETQVYFAGIGQQVAERIKAFGAGTGLSDKDREFAEKIAGGSITLTPAAIKRILDMNDKSATGVIRLYNERRANYAQRHPEVMDYYPEIRAPGQWKITKK